MLPVYKKGIQKIAVSHVIMVLKYNFCLVVLESPFWKVGWAGISYVSAFEELRY